MGVMPTGIWLAVTTRAGSRVGVCHGPLSSTGVVLQHQCASASPERHVKMDSCIFTQFLDWIGLWWGPRIFLSSKFPSGVDAASPGTIFDVGLIHCVHPNSVTGDGSLWPSISSSGPLGLELEASIDKFRLHLSQLHKKLRAAYS